MNRNFTLFSIVIVFLSSCILRKNQLPDEFVYVHQAIPNIFLDIRYFENNNFMRQPIDGYKKPIAILTKPASIALQKVQHELNQKGYSLIIFDAYRPQTAVNHFIKWAKNLEDTIAKREYYPEIDKSQLFELGYISERSGHTRGSTLDLSIVDLKTKKNMDMGSSFDFFGSKSHHDYQQITEKQKQNRQLLKSTMEKYGFKHYSEEWWHYTLANEPFPNTYFDFPVK